MKSIFNFAMICLYLLGSIGGLGYALYNKAWLVAIGVAVLAYMAFPKAKEYYNDNLK
jgi:hypothetical protein